MKNLLKIIFINFSAILLYTYVRLVFATTKKIFVDNKTIKDFDATSPIIIATWHGRLAPMFYMKNSPRDVYTIISQHTDGEIISKVSNMFGLKSIRGSVNRTPEPKKRAKNRGGASVIRKIIEVLESGHNVAITPDGPKGPAFKCKKNFVQTALKTNAKILPISFSATCAHQFSSWDKFLLPLPFGKIYYVCGDIIESSTYSEQNIHEFQIAIENEINRITLVADKLANRNTPQI